jgi:two-component system, chemotaxis family, sensor kinase CheA
MDFDQECINDFIEESVENLDLLDDAFVHIEKDPSNALELDNIFRVMHTMKGGCRLIGMVKLERIAHIAETLLDLAREKQLVLGSNHISLLLKTVDILRYFVESIRQTNKEPEGEFDALTKVLEAASQQKPFDSQSLNIEQLKSSQAQAKSSSGQIEPAMDETWDVIEDVETWEPSENLAEAPPVKQESKTSTVVTERAPQVKPVMVEPTSHPKPVVKLPDAPVSVTESSTPVVPEQRRLKLPALVVQEERKTEQVSSNSAAENTIRIDVKRLDKLMDLVGELVLSRNQLKQINIKMADPLLNGTTNAISLITSELQEEIVKSRLQPISTVVNKFQRTIRDLALSLGKEVELELSGMSTELDRTLLESIKDPLTHLIRNSVDHGIELPQERLLRKKNRCGKIAIHCYHDGGQVVIEIKDDGAGLDPIKIGNKALAKRLVTRERLDKMSSKEIYRFIFNAGFSTAEVVTSVSGRGVGMDVVQTNITSIGGQIDVDSIPGKETTIHLQIPLTLAIIPALMIQTDHRHFSIPQGNLQELIFLESSDNTKIERFNHTEVYRLRGQLMPLLRLRTLMGLKEISSSHVYIIVLVCGDQRFGLIVDEVGDTEEIVVKPLAKFFNEVRYFSGATILGDGSISLILDVDAIAQASQMSKGMDKSRSVKPISRTKAASTALIFNLGGEERMGIQMSQICRLEEILASSIERSGKQEMIQYRGDILPIVRLSKYIDIDEHFDKVERLGLIVFKVNQREMGLLVKEIEDALPLEGDLDTSVIEHPLILGTMTLKGDIVLMLDALKIFEQSFPRFAVQAPIALVGAPARKTSRVLYVDDSTFYLKVVRRYLSDAGYEVDVAINGYDGLEKIKAHAYDLLLIDYEMPGMDGLELIGEVRKMESYDLIPIIVLTALTGGREKFNLINSGIQSYLVKLNNRHRKTA